MASESHWHCIRCDEPNKAERWICNHCGASKPNVCICRQCDEPNKLDRSRCHHCQASLFLSKMGQLKCAPIRFLLIGNSGRGKSTILNAMIGKPVFKAGVSWGKGLTSALSEHKPEGQRHIFMDTPGMDDPSLNEVAARAISESLRRGGCYKVLFIMTLESGRLRQQDLETMQTISRVAQLSSYAVVVNQLSPQAVKKFEDPTALDEFRTTLWPSSEETMNMYLMPLDEDFQQRQGHEQDTSKPDDRVLNLPPDFFNFVQQLPVIQIDCSNQDDFEARIRGGVAYEAERARKAAEQEQLELDRKTRFQEVQILQLLWNDQEDSRHKEERRRWEQNESCLPSKHRSCETPAPPFQSRWKRLKEIRCPCCSTEWTSRTGYFDKDMRHERCECASGFSALSCPHCGYVNMGPGKTNPEHEKIICQSPSCRRPFQKIQCPHCRRFNDWMDEFRQRERYTCAYHDCCRPIQQYMCGLCGQCSVNNDGLHTEGDIWTCATCKDRTRQIRCPHPKCHTSRIWRPSEFRQGQTYSCTSCTQPVQVVFCPSENCGRMNVWLQGDYNPCKHYTCAYEGCSQVFNKVPCIGCGATYSFRDGPLKEGHSMKCDDRVQGCGKKTFYLQCPHCNTFQGHEGQLQEGKVYSCSSLACRKTFQKAKCASDHVNTWKDCSFKFGRKYTCAVPNCGKPVHKIRCPREKCLETHTVIEDAECDRLTCKTCKSDFQYVFCPHCEKLLNWKRADFRLGMEYKCAYTTCAGPFLKLKCRSCSAINSFKDGFDQKHLCYQCSQPL